MKKGMQLTGLVLMTSIVVVLGINHAGRSGEKCRREWQRGFESTGATEDRPAKTVLRLPEFPSPLLGIAFE